MSSRKQRDAMLKNVYSSLSDEVPYSALENNFLFSSDMKSMSVLNKNNTELPISYLLSDGISLSYVEEDIVVNAPLPSGDDIVPLSNFISFESGYSFTGISLRNFITGEVGNEEKHVVVAAAGIGVIDFMDTDPVQLMFLSYELNATVAIPSENGGTVQAKILSVLIDSGTTNGNLIYSSATGDIESNQFDEMPTVRFTTYYQILSNG